MRVIGTIEGEKEAYRFSSFLKEEEIEYSCEPQTAKENTFTFWIMDENELEGASHWLEEFKKNPEDPRFETKAHPIDTQGVAEDRTEGQETPSYQRRPSQKKRWRRMPLTRLISIACVILFFWNVEQSKALPQSIEATGFETLTPLFIDLSYDAPPVFSHSVDFFKRYPVKTKEEFERVPEEAKKAYEQVSKTPVWRGLYRIMLEWPQAKADLAASMFIKLREGEVWRLFTPCLMRGSFLHILFNMMWLWMLGAQLEERLKKWQYLVITVIIGVISNTVQYLMSGPFFIGYSGIVCGLAGFIWMRQRRAPWEGYPLQKGSSIFLGIFVIGMWGLQIVSFILTRFHLTEFSMNIANSAHVAGAVTGMILGSIPLFSKDPT